MKIEGSGISNGTDETLTADGENNSSKLEFCYAADESIKAAKPILATGWEYVLTERLRQMSHSGWSQQYDDSFVKWELRRAAECYARPPFMRRRDENGVPKRWPWEARWWKSSEDWLSNKSMAGALYLAESERVRRLGHYSAAVILRNRAIACARLIDRVLFSEVLKKAGPLERGKVSGRNFRYFFEKHRAPKIAQTE
jgi:hypothetical protein